MTIVREAGQSVASAIALSAYFDATQRTSDARSDVRRLQRQLREARAALKANEAAEQTAELAYIDTPYLEES